jgi:hypothetical protein
MIETMTLSINYYYRVDSVEGVKNRSKFKPNKKCDNKLKKKSKLKVMILMVN